MFPLLYKSMKNWNGILKILEIQHKNPQGDILWTKKNIHNILHQDGEEFLLRAAFTGGRDSSIIPDDYYLGMDNRIIVDATDDMDSLIGEPGSGGYDRQAVSSTGDFSVNFENDHWSAVSPIVAFQATSGNWGPVSQLFLTDKSDNTGFLISTASLDNAITVNNGDSVTVRIGMQLRDCDGTS